MNRLRLLSIALPLLAVCKIATAAPYPFSDGYEGGLLNWAATGDWSTTPVVAHSGLLSATDSHGAFYPNNMDASLTLASGMDLSSAVRPALAFYHRYSLETGYDFGRVEVSTDGGATWLPLSGAEFTGETAGFVREQFDLTAFVGRSDFRFRFRLATDASVQRDGWYVDDVVVAEAPAPVVLAPPTPVSGTRVDLAWSASTAPDFAAYQVYRSGTAGTPWQLAHLVAIVTNAATTACTDYSVGPKATYHYQVLAITQTGLSATSNARSVVTPIGVAYPFLDDGEGGVSHWSADAPWALTAEQASSPTHGWSDSPGGNYSNGIPSQAMTLVSPVNLAGSGATAPVLSYRHRYALGSGDSVNTEISINGGADWTTLGTFTGTSSGWCNGWHDLTAYAGATAVLVRFRLTSDAGNSPGDGWYLDDIALCEQPAAMPEPTVVSVNRQAIELSWPAYTGLDFHHYALYRASTSAVGINDTLVATLSAPGTTTFNDTAVVLDTDYYYRVFVVNGFGAHGAPSAVAATARARSLPVRPGYTNDFETALGPEWVPTGTWARSDEAAHGGGFGFTDSPGVNYPKSSDTATSITLDLTGTYWPVLRFWHKRQFGSGDYGAIERSTDGVNWTQVVRFGGDAPLWSDAGIDLSQWKNLATLRIRFRVVSDSGTETGDGWHIDDLRIEDHAGGLAALPIVEGFESGLGEWLTDWRPDPAAPHEGANAAHSVGGDSEGYSVYATSYLTYGREVAVPAGTDHYLSFWVRDTSASEGYGQHNLYVEVSQDGGVTWATPFGEYDNTIPEIWSMRQVSLAAYKGQTIRVRLRQYAYHAVYGNFVVDSMVLEPVQAPSAVSLTRLTQVGNSVAVDWTASAIGTDFKNYSVYRWSSADSTPVLIGTFTNAATTNLTDTGLLYGDRYYYRVDVTSMHELTTPSAVLNIAILPAPAAVPLDDGLEDLANWSVNGNWATATNAPHGGAAYAEGLSRPGTDSEMAVTLDLRGLNWPVLSLYDRCFGNATRFRVEYSTTDGASWSKLTLYGGSQPQWLLKQYDLSPWKNQPAFRLRFRIDASEEGAAYWHIDDLRIEDHAGGLAALPIVEGFESGLGEWLTDWRSDPAAPHEGANAAHSVGGDSEGYSVYATSYLTYGREVAVPAGTDHYLSFWVRDTSASEGYGQHNLYVEVSQDGGVTWATPFGEYDNTIPEIWSMRQVSLAAYKGQTIRVRLRQYAYHAVYGNFVVDSMVLEPVQAPSAVSLTRLTQVGNSVAVDWTASAIGTDFKNYSVYRWSSADSTPVLIGTFTNAATTNLTDTGLLYGDRYYYRVDVTSMHELTTPSAVLNIAILPAPAAVPLDDGLEDLANWSVNGNWATATNAPHGGAAYAEGLSRPGTDSEMAVTLDLRGLNWPVLSLYDRCFGNATRFRVEYSTTDGASWSKLTLYGGSQPQWLLKQYDLSPWKNQPAFRLRFRIDASEEGAAYWHIDDLRIEDHAGGLAALPLVEGFESGLGEWLTDWRSDPAAPHEGANAAHSVGGDSEGYSVYATSYLTYGREVAVPAGTDHYLSFWVRDTSASEGYGQHNLYVEVSQDGGVTWATPFGEQDNTIAESWSVRQVSLAAYKGQTIRVRLRQYAYHAVYGNFVVDFLSIGEEKPSAPMLQSPADFTVTDQQRPFLSVVNAVDPQDDVISGYRFEVYGDPDLTNLVAQVPVVAEGATYTSWQVDVDLPFEAQYWWRARATDIKGNVGDWMTTASFLVSISNQPPAAPEIVRPVEGEILDSLSELMAWHPAVDPNQGDAIVAYHVQIDTRGDFSAPLVDVLDVASPIATASDTGAPAVVLVMSLADLAGTNSLPTGTALYWRIRARDRFFAWSGWSGAESFSVATSPGQSYGHWRQRQFNEVEGADPSISGTAASPRGDGVVNILKYAFNMDPTLAATGAGRVLTPGTGTSGIPYIGLETSGGLRLRVEYVRRRHAADLLYQVQFCTILTATGTPDGWAAPTDAETVTPIDTDWERVVVEDQPPPGASSRFGRVLVIQR